MGRCLGDAEVAESESPGAEQIGAGAPRGVATRSEWEVELVVAEIGVEDEGTVVPDGGPEVGAAEDEEAGGASRGGGEMTTGQSIEAELRVLGLELVGGGGEGGVEGGEDAEFWREGQVVGSGPQEGLAVDVAALRSHHDTSGRAAFTCSAVTLLARPRAAAMSAW